jgi:DNA repair protein RecN (Recombination protein N)
MLRSIYIDNYALIEKLELELGDGLSIITGETGAGKSILLGALGLLLGKRADTSVLKDHARKCIVEGIFNIGNYNLQNFFEANEIEYVDDTILRREISNTGKSRAFVNDTPVNLQVLQELTLHLIDIHSQHQNLSLNNEEYILWIIDAFAGLKDQTYRFQELFEGYTRLRSKYQAELNSYREDQQDLEFMTHQFNELRSAGLKPGELEVLEQQSSLLSHAEEIKTALEGSENLLSADESGISPGIKRILDMLTRIRQHFGAADKLCNRLESIYIELKDIDSELVHLSEQADIDPEQLSLVNQRIDLIQTLLHKYRVNDEAELIAIRDQLDEKLQKFALSDEELEKMKRELAEREGRVKQEAHRLSDERKKVFAGFREQIQQLLRGLGMKNAQFSIRHEESELTARGIDHIQFYFSANKNIAEQNLARVASGGELSRLMLAIKYLISGASGLPTIIFDEIDAGVSGEIADSVGNLIKEMAGKMQVVNITHLPQVASKGDQHYLVYKESRNGTTKTLIRRLDDSERLNEIARMLSGDSITQAAIENAKVLLGR